MAKKPLAIDFSANEDEMLSNAGAITIEDAPVVRIDAEKDLPRRRVRTSFEMSYADHRDLREWSVRHDISMKRILFYGLKMLKEKHGV